MSNRECGQFRPYVHENFEKFKIISTPTGSWLSPRRDRIQLHVGVEIFKIFMNIGTELPTLSMGHSTGTIPSNLFSDVVMFEILGWMTSAMNIGIIVVVILQMDIAVALSCLFDFQQSGEEVRS